MCNETVRRIFKSTNRPNLSWIYCSITHCTMVLWQKCGIFTLNLITGIMVYNYSMYLWLSYSISAFILNVFRLLFSTIIFFTMVLRCYMCGFMCVYCDLNVCYYGRPMLDKKIYINTNKKTLVRVNLNTFIIISIINIIRQPKPVFLIWNNITH